MYFFFVISTVRWTKKFFGKFTLTFFHVVLFLIVTSKNCHRFNYFFQQQTIVSNFCFFFVISTVCWTKKFFGKFIPTFFHVVLFLIELQVRFFVVSIIYFLQPITDSSVSVDNSESPQPLEEFELSEHLIHQVSP